MKDKECILNICCPRARDPRHFNKVLTTLLLLLFAWCKPGSAQQSNHSLTYQETIAAYRRLDSTYVEARMFPYGKTDCGEPLQLFVISSSQLFDPVTIHEQNKCLLMINNGIHPGEPDGIDASVRLSTDLLSNPLYHRMLENVVICIVPVFNIDGALERGCCSRANQDGPDEYGFRANAKNLDLNRDFMKMDARNTKSLINILRKWEPDVFIDTHVSDGADYQYTMTLIAGQHNKLNSPISAFMHDTFVPALFTSMKERGDEMSPYVDTYNKNRVPDSGFVAFLETPRFLGGYQSLFNCFTFTSESHMLKPFPQRVISTLNLLSSLVEFCNVNSTSIITARKKAYEETNTIFKYNWEMDSTRYDTLLFKGYTAEITNSKITSGKRLSYNRAKPYTKPVKHFNYYNATDSIIIPKYFVVPQAWDEIIVKLEMNGIKFIRVTEDSTTRASVFFIEDYKTVQSPFEGHYLHNNVKLRNEIQTVKIRKGDYLIPLPQKNNKFIMEALVPDAVDSYFCWGFFDSMLQQKEWFSDYVFEDIADSLLAKDAKLKKDYREWQSNNKTASEYEQLNFIYQRSPYFEKTFLRYPVFMIK